MKRAPFLLNCLRTDVIYDEITMKFPIEHNERIITDEVDISQATPVIKSILVFIVFLFVPMIIVVLALWRGLDLVVPMGQMQTHALTTVSDILPGALAWAALGLLCLYRIHRKKNVDVCDE